MSEVWKLAEITKEDVAAIASRAASRAGVTLVEVLTTDDIYASYLFVVRSNLHTYDEYLVLPFWGSVASAQVFEDRLRDELRDLVHKGAAQ